jgi:hypothetical protein
MLFFTTPIVTVITQAKNLQISLSEVTEVIFGSPPEQHNGANKCQNKSRMLTGSSK